VELSIGLALAALTLTVYSPCFRHPFVNFDDEEYVTRNPHVQAGLTAGGVRWAFTTLDCGNWHPLTWLSLQLDATLYGGLRAGGFHLTNVLLHAASTLLLFLVLGRMTGAVWRSAVVAGLFALHPLNVEPVAWVAERKGVLSTLFWMLALAAYLAYVRRPGVRRYLLIVLALVLGLMAKPMLVTLPFVLLLLDYWPLRRLQIESKSAICNLKSAILEKLPLFILVLAWCVLAFLGQRRIDALPSLEAYPLDVRVWNALLAYVAYLGKMFWPARLAVHYPHPGAAVSVVAALAAGLLLAVITVLVLGLGRRRPYLAVGWLWYLGTLLPVIGLVQIGGHGMADRYTYVPLIGLFLLVTWGAADLMAARKLPRFYPAAAATLVLAACAVLTWIQLGYWKSDRDLWEHALAVTENNALAHNNLGMVYFGQGRVGLAEKEFDRAVTLAPRVALFHHNRATLLRDRGRPDEALAECSQAVALSPRDALFHYTLGNLLRDLGREDEALAELQESVHLDPDSPQSHGNLANVLLDLGRREEAVAEYRRAIDLDPRYASPHVGLGNALAELGRREEALAEYHRAIDLGPKSPVAHLNLGMALQEEGRLEAAAVEYRKAVELGYGQALPRLQQCEKLRALRPRLPELLAGRDQPADNAERLAFADLCGQPFEGRYALAARLYADAFHTDPTLTGDLRTAYGSDAATVAARAGCGQGQDAAGLDEAEKARLRLQALGWLRAELALWTEQIQGDSPPPARVAARQALRAWQRSTGLAGVRDPEALALLPEAERAAWQKLWQEVEAVLSGVAG
jgi:tetratricopeptide (TPR) repeat protein